MEEEGEVEGVGLDQGSDPETDGPQEPAPHKKLSPPEPPEHGHILQHGTFPNKNDSLSKLWRTDGGYKKKRADSLQMDKVGKSQLLFFTTSPNPER